MDIGESVSPPASGKHDDTCPFCGGEEPELLHLHTKDGAKKNERALGKNLRSSDMVVTESGVGEVWPLPGGSDNHKGWTVPEGVFADIAVFIKPTPHHLLPGNAAMAKSKVETWTLASKGKIKEDVGYNIDGADNGIWLPHLPHIHWTSYMDRAKKIRFSDHYGTWKDLSPEEQTWIGIVVMGDTQLQMHYTDHDDAYAHVDNDTTYDDEALERCNLLADLMQDVWSRKCPKERKKKKLDPPYGIIERLNLQSQYMRNRISGPPKRWKSWVSPLAQDYTQSLIDGSVPTDAVGVVSAT
jgi:hypothetical protein